MNIDLQIKSPDTGFDFGDSDHVVCQWDEEYCPEQATHRVIRRHTLDGDEVEGDMTTFCARHYVLILAHELEVVLPKCGHKASDHFARIGRIGDEGVRFERNR